MNGRRSGAAREEGLGVVGRHGGRLLGDSKIIREETVALGWYSMSIASTLVIGLALATLAASLYNRPKLIFSSS